MASGRHKHLVSELVCPRLGREQEAAWTGFGRDLLVIGPSLSDRGLADARLALAAEPLAGKGDEIDGRLGRRLLAGLGAAVGSVLELLDRLEAIGRGGAWVARDADSDAEELVGAGPPWESRGPRSFRRGGARPA